MTKIANVIVIDASSSMMSKTDEVRGGLQELFTSIKEEAEKFPEIDNFVAVVQFSNPQNVEILVQTDDVELLTDELANNYVPNGWTALYDGIGKAFELIPEDSDGVFLSIMTDGEENSSQKYSSSQIKELVENAKKKNWAVSFMGTTQDAMLQAESMGVSRGMMLSYQDSDVGTITANNVRNTSFTSYYNAVATNSVTSDTVDNLIVNNSSAVITGSDELTTTSSDARE